MLSATVTRIAFPPRRRPARTVAPHAQLVDLALLSVVQVE